MGGGGLKALPKELLRKSSRITSEKTIRTLSFYVKSGREELCSIYLMYFVNGIRFG